MDDPTPNVVIGNDRIREVVIEARNASDPKVPSQLWQRQQTYLLAAILVELRNLSVLVEQIESRIPAD